MYDMTVFKKMVEENLKNGSCMFEEKYLFDYFSVSNSTNSKKAFFKEVERFFEFEKVKTYINILSIRKKELPKEHKKPGAPKGNKNKKGKFKLKPGNMKYLYTQLIMSVLKRDKEEETGLILEKSTTIGSLCKKYFDIDRSKRNYVEIYKSQYFKAGLEWLEKVNCINIQKKYMAVRCVEKINMETGEFIYEEDFKNPFDLPFGEEGKEFYELYLDCVKFVFENFFKEKYKSQNNFSIFATPWELELNKNLITERMSQLTRGAYGVEEHEFISMVYQTIEIRYTPENSKFGNEFDYVFEENYFKVIDKMAFIMYNKNDLVMYQEKYINCLLYKGSLSKEEVKSKCKVLADYVSLNERALEVYTEDDRRRIEKLILPKKISFR